MKEENNEVIKTLVLRMPLFNAFWPRKIRNQWFKDYFILLKEAQKLDLKKDGKNLDDAREILNDEF